MDIIVNVSHQRLRIANDLKTLVAGTQRFIRFVFKLPNEWSNLRVFAQFTQNGQAYNTYLDQNNSAYLPSQIVSGTCTLMLYGTAPTNVSIDDQSVSIRATTNILSFSILPNMLVEGVESTDIPETLYEQLIEEFNELKDQIVNMDDEQVQQLIQTQITTLINNYMQTDEFVQRTIAISDNSIGTSKLANGAVTSDKLGDNAVTTSKIYDGAVTSSKINNGAVTSDKLSDSAVTTDKVNNGAITTAKLSDGSVTTTKLSDGSVTTGKLDDGSVTEAKLANNAVTTDKVNNGAITTAKIADGAITSAKVDGTVATKTYVDGVSYSIVVLENSTLPQSPNPRTFYLVPKDTAGKYDKYWYIDTGDGTMQWDMFGGSSTAIVNSLPVSPDPDVDYILNTNGEYSFYKYINNGWRMISGGGGEIITPNNIEIIMFGEDSPVTLEIPTDDFIGGNVQKAYLNITNFSVWIVSEETVDEETTYSWERTTDLIASPSNNKDYYIQDPNGNWAHFRYINNVFERIAVDAYNRSEIDSMLNSMNTSLTSAINNVNEQLSRDIEMLQDDIDDSITDINGELEDHSSSISTLGTRITNVNNSLSTLGGQVNTIAAEFNKFNQLVSDVTATDDGLVVHYADETQSQPIPIKDNTPVVEDITKSASGIVVSYTNGQESKEIEISGGGGGGSTSGSASISRVSAQSLQCVYGDPCNIVFLLNATDASGEVLSTTSTATWYVGGVRRATSSVTSGVNTTFNIGPYLSVGTNNVRLSITVDTGGDTPITTTKTWSVNAISLYLEWDYNDAEINTESTTLIRYTPYGDLSKTTHVIIDGVERDDLRTTTTRSGIQQVITLSKLSHGSHMVQLYLTANVGGQQVTSESIYHDMIFVDENSNVPIISSSLSQYDVMQYNTLRIPFVVYNPSSLTSSATLKVDGETVSTMTNIDRTVQSWNYTPNDTGSPIVNIVQVLPQNATENDDYVVDDDGTYYHYKWFEDDWILIGEIPAIVIEYESGVVIAGTDVTEPTLDTDENQDKYYVKTDTMTLYHCEIPTGQENYAWVVDSSLVPIPSDTAEYFLLDENGDYCRYKYVDGIFVPVGTKTLSIISGAAKKNLFINVSKLSINNEEVGGYTFRISASDIPGNDALQEWSSNGIDATFSENFDWNNGGIKTEVDDDGNLRQYVCVKAGTRMTINHKLFADDPTVYGKTFKIIFKTTNCRDYDAQIAHCYANGVGLQMSAHDAQFSSTGTSLSVPYGEDEYVELEFDIYPAPNETNGSHRYMMAWIDGVITTCRVYGESDNFTQSNASQEDIIIGSDDCDVYVYMIKSYSNYITRDNHIINFIADAPNAQEMVKRYNRNDILDGSGDISYEKLRDNNPDCRVWLYDIPYMTVGKKDKVKNCTFNQFWANGDKYYELSGTGTITVQGTSSVDYLRGAANTDISFSTLYDGNDHDLLANGVVDEDSYGKNYFVGDTDTGEVTVFTVDANTQLTPDCIPVERDANRNVTKYIKALGYKVNDDSTPITYSNTKVNFASCEQVNNMCNAIWYQRFQPYQSLTPRDCMEFSMGVQFIKDSGTIPDNDHFVLFGDSKYHMYSIGNMGTSKKNVHVFHDLSNPLECCVEVGNNLNDLCRMVTDDMSNSIWFGGSDKSFEMRYPDTDTPSQTLTDNWQRFVTWMATSNPNAATGEALAQPETYGVYTFRGHNRSGTQVLRGTSVSQYAGTYTNDTFERRMAKMLSECEDYMVMDSVIYHFVYLERHTMCDNVAKNSFWSSSDGIHWDLSKAYDMDTSDGNNNEGQMVFDYGNEANDIIGSKTVFNANDAVWFVFSSNLYEACQTMFTNREAAGAWSSTAYHNFLLSEQRKVPERCWNECYWYDYLRTYEEGINDAWMSFLDGGQKTHQRWHYEYFEEIYDSSKYRGTSCTVQNVNFRGYYPSKWEGITNEQWELLKPKAEIQLKMYNKCYINVSIDGTFYSQKAERGQTYTVDFSAQSKLNDTVINIYSAQMIQEIGDISRLYPGTPNFSNATRLRSLTIGSSTEGYMNSNLTGVTLGNNKMLEYLYVQNLAYVTSNLNLTNCQSLLYLNASGSSFTGYEFATGGLLHTAYIDTPTSLMMRNLYYLDNADLHIADYSKLDTIVLEGCPGINSLNIVNNATSLAVARLVDIDWTLPETTVLNRLLTLQGRDESSHVTATSVLSGDVYVSGLIRNQELLRYADAWPNLEVTYDNNNLIQQHLITYVNADDEHTVLYETYVDQGSTPPDPYALGLIEKPTLESTAQYTYEFGTIEDDEYVPGSGWDDVTTIVAAPRTIVAVFSRTVRKYTVTWYARSGLPLKTLNNVTYGSEVVYDGETPTYTDGEANNIYRIFKGWDKSTGYVRSNIDVYAQWDECFSLPSSSVAMNDMTYSQIYGVAKAGLTNTYWPSETMPEHYKDIELGCDFNFNNVSSTTIGTDVTLSGIPVDTFVSGGYYFNGSKAATTNIKLFDEDSPAFTMAIDFQLTDNSTPNSTVVSTYSGQSEEGFKLYQSGTSSNPAIAIKWGDQIATVGYGRYRDIIVLRHPQGSNYLYVYSAGNGSGEFANQVTRTNMVRANATQTSEPITFGGIHYTDGYRNYCHCHIHWCKIWYDDLGDTNASKLANWSHEKVRMEFWGANKYYQYGTARTSNASFIANLIPSGLGGRTYHMYGYSYNTRGWPSSDLRTFCNGRLFNALPIQLQSTILSVEINSKAVASDATVTATSDKVYIPSYREIGGYSQDFYNGEIGLSDQPISWFTSDSNRVKFRGLPRIYASDRIYRSSSEPSATYTTSLNLGDIWINSSNSRIGYIFVPRLFLTQYGISPDVSVNNEYADGGWIMASAWWTRSIYSWDNDGYQMPMYINEAGNYNSYADPTSQAGVVFGISI